eukprot:CAMPEP_0118878442 /NCGR_PEP_ID=MMETSP1163-20130328/18335_1 /TAXON_ID=124430 /ORGANISM="Phaeomonas parva, Strain CCMP2877" /LENGTH=37 /DNA_ID= /DNA_START= /DNA_END= /DNA_ORIENTATION=
MPKEMAAAPRLFVRLETPAGEWQVLCPLEPGWAQRRV